LLFKRQNFIFCSHEKIDREELKKKTLVFAAFLELLVIFPPGQTFL
jgi:hypothetical protein